MQQTSKDVIIGIDVSKDKLETDLFAKTEGIIIAPETSHAVTCVIQEAKKAKEEEKEKVILFNLSGHGLMDLRGYDDYLSNKLHDYELPQADLEKYSACLSELPKPNTAKTGKW